MEIFKRLWFFAKQGFAGLLKNRFFTVTSILTITVSFFLIGLFKMVTLNLNYLLAEAETTVGVTVFFIEKTPEEEILKLRDELLKNRSEIDEIFYISGEQAWEGYKKQYLSADLIQSFGNDNPLEESASLEIHLKNISAQEEIVKHIETKSIVRKVNSSTKTAESLSQLVQAADLVSFLFTVVLIAVSVLLIDITISTGVNIRRNEISIMSIIGASDVYIIAPFLVEGFIIGVIGAFIPMISMRRLYEFAMDYLAERFTGILSAEQLMGSREFMMQMNPLMIGLGVGIGLVGSYVATRIQVYKMSRERK
ncbi:MAG: permease-like cell division protein FtsX [Lachnospiraceae bacterium]|nr:permease-like cell division protein FtsX [Lachnospiraceae bacterium]